MEEYLNATSNNSEPLFASEESLNIHVSGSPNSEEMQDAQLSGRQSLQRTGSGLQTQEQFLRGKFGDCYELSTRMQGEHHAHFSKQFFKLKQAETVFREKLSEFQDAFDALEPEEKVSFEPLEKYAQNLFAENNVLREYFDIQKRKPMHDSEIGRRKFRNEVFSAISKVNYVRNQHAMVLRALTSYVREFSESDNTEDKVHTEHVLSVFISSFTAFDAADTAPTNDEHVLDERINKAVQRAEVIKAMLVTRSSKHTLRALTPEEAVEKAREQMVEKHVEKLNQPSLAETEARKEALRPYQERFDKLLMHDESNKYSMFWIPTSMLSQKKEGKYKDAVDIDAPQLAQMNQSVLSLYALSSDCDYIIANSPSDSGVAVLAAQFKDAVFKLESVMQKYSYDAHSICEKILKDKKTDSVQKKKILNEIRDKMVELSSHHGHICARMTELLNKYSDVYGKKSISELSSEDRSKLKMIEKAADRCAAVNPGVKDLHDMGVNLDKSYKLCSEAVQTLDDFERLAMGLISTSGHSVNEQTTELVGDEARRCSGTYERRFKKELNSIDLIRSYSIGDTKDMTSLLNADGVEMNVESTESEHHADQARQIVHQSRISQLRGNMEKHIPEKEMKKLKDYVVNEQKREGVSKFRAYRIRKGYVSDGKLTAAVNAHVDRMLQSRELSDADLAAAAANIGESTGVISKDMLEKKLKGRENTVLYARLVKFKELSEKDTGDDILSMAGEIRELLGVKGSKEVDFDDQYFTKYPQALKTVLLYKLISDIHMPGEDKTAKEIRERINAAKEGIGKLYTVLTESKDYKDALEAQTKESVSMPKSLLSDMMFKPNSELVTDRFVSVFEWEDEINKHREITAEGLKTRVRFARVSNDVVAAQQELREREIREFAAMSEEDKDKRVKSNYERALRRVSEYDRTARYAKLARKPVKLPPYLEQVGQGAVDELLAVNLKDMLFSYFEDAKLTDIYAVDQIALLNEVKFYAVKTGHAGVKRREDIAKLSLDQLMEFVTLASTRLSTYPAFLNKVASVLARETTVATPNLINAEQRAVIIRMLFSGKELDENKIATKIESMNARGDFLKKSKFALLYGGKVTVIPRFHNDLTKLKINTSGKIELRSQNRLKRMEDIDSFVDDTCKGYGVKRPKTFYEFATEMRFVETSRTVAEEELKEEYKNYISKTWYKNQIKEKEHDPKFSEIKKSLSEVKKSLTNEKDFMNYGILKYGAVLSGAIGTVKVMGNTGINDVDLLNDTERDVFENNLISNLLKNIVDKEVALRRYCSEKNVMVSDNLLLQMSVLYNEPDYADRMHKVVDYLAQHRIGQELEEFNRLSERRDRRVSAIKSSDYGILLPLFMEDETFTDHLVADDDEEFDDFSAEYFPRAKAVVLELERNLYTEQYLIGKKKEILECIFDPDYEHADIRKHLSLEDYDRTVVEATVVKDDPNPDKRVTLNKLIFDALNNTKTIKSKKSSADFGVERGNVCVMALIYDGPDAMFDEKKMKGYLERTGKNSDHLNAAIQKVIEKRERENKYYSKKRKEAITKSIFQNERRNLFLVDADEYDRHVNANVESWFDENDTQEALDEEHKTQLSEIEESMKKLLMIKNAGRAKFADYFSETDRMRSLSEKAYKDQVKALGSEANAEAFFNAKAASLPTEISKMLDTFFSTEKDSLPDNGVLNSFYNETLARLAYHACLDDVEVAKIELMKEHNCFEKVRSFYTIADTFLAEFKDTKELSKQSRSNVIKDLMNFYGEKLISPDYHVEEDVIKPELTELFDKEKGGTELLRYLEHDSGGYYGVGSDGYSYNDSPLIRLDRAGFDSELKQLSAHDRKLKKQLEIYSDLDNDTKILVGHLLVRDDVLYSPGGFFLRAFFKDNIQSGSRTDVVLSYLRGEELAEPDYMQVVRAFATDGKEMLKRFSDAVALAGDISTMKLVDGLAVTTAEYDALLDETKRKSVETEVNSLEAKYEGADKVYALSKAIAKDYQIESYRTNSDKMWSFYASLRPYESEIAAYPDIHDGMVMKIEDEALEEKRREKDESKHKEIDKRADTRKAHCKHIMEMCNNYVKLKGYTLLLSNLKRFGEEREKADTEEKKLKALKEIYKTRQEMAKVEAFFGKLLGLTDSKSQMSGDDEALGNGTASLADYEEALSRNTEQAREEFDAFLDQHTLRLDGVKTKNTISRSDEDEKAFPENVIKAVHAIDRWVARYCNSLAEGNSEANFAVDILSHPMRERLFAYYMVENKLVGQATGAEIAMSVNGYVPDLPRFREVMEAPFYSVHSYLISGIKSMDIIRKRESVRSKLARFGAINQDLLEGAMRLLDDQKNQVSEQLAGYKDRLLDDFTPVLSKNPNDEKLIAYAKAWEDRQKKFERLLVELEKLRRLAQISDEAIVGKEDKAEAAKAQSLVVRNHIIEMNAAVEVIERLENEAGEDANLKDKLEQVIGRKIHDVSKDKSTSQKVDGVAGKVKTITGFLTMADSKLFKTGVFSSVEGVVALAKIATACFAPVFSNEPVTADDRFNEAREILSSLAGASKPVAELLRVALNSTSTVFATVGGAVAGGLTMIKSVAEIGVATANLDVLESAEQSVHAQTQRQLQQAIESGDEKKIHESREKAKATDTVAKMQKRKLETRREQSSINAVGGAVTVATALIPGLNVVGAAVSGIITVVGIIHKFYKEGENRNDALDDFLGMSNLLVEYRAKSKVLGYGTKDEKEEKKLIRGMMLRKFHFSSVEEFFNDLSMRYAQLIYKMLFFKEDGSPVLSTDRDEIKARADYIGLFPELQGKFRWPSTEGEQPSPTVDQLAANLMAVS